MFIGNLNQKQTSALKISILKVDEKKVWDVPIESPQISLKNKFPTGNYRLIVENNSSNDITITALKQLETKNIQGPVIQKNGKMVPGLNLAFNFNEIRGIALIPMSTYLVIYLFFFFLLILSWFLDRRKKLNVVRT